MRSGEEEVGTPARANNTRATWQIECEIPNPGCRFPGDVGGADTVVHSPTVVANAGERSDSVP